tara:strand:+ start:7893 stop:8159 length:267 start_codon:yes stop_codon:yes gene_type:complete
MPLYSFISKDGKVIEKVVKSGTDRLTIDGTDYERSIANEGFAVSGQVKLPSQAEQVRAGYYQQEQKQGSRFLKKSKFTTKQIKKAWGF